MSGPHHHLAQGLRVVLGRPGLFLLYGGLEVLSAVATFLPIALALLLLSRAFLRALPIGLLALDVGVLSDAVLAYLSSGQFVLPVVGLALAGGLLSGVLRLFYLSGALGVFSADLAGRALPGQFMDSALRRFPGGIGAGALVLATGLLWGAWTAGLLWSASVLYSAGIGGGGGAVLGASALAVALTVLVFSALLFEILARLTLIRVLVMGDGPAVGLWEAVAVAGRRLGYVLVIAVVVLIVHIAVGLSVTGATMPAGFLPTDAAFSGWALAARTAGWLLRLLSLALVALVAWTAFTALVLDDAGRLPAPPSRNRRSPLARPIPRQPVLVARPAPAGKVTPEAQPS